MASAARRLPVRFSAQAWTADLQASSPVGALAARAARRRYARSGVPLAELRPCAAEARDGTRLPNCVKAYLPPPDGRFGMVFEVRHNDQQLVLMYLAYGVRHHPHESHALSVYAIAHRRLHGTPLR